MKRKFFSELATLESHWWLETSKPESRDSNSAARIAWFRPGLLVPLAGSKHKNLCGAINAPESIQLSLVLSHLNIPTGHDHPRHVASRSYIHLKNVVQMSKRHWNLVLQLPLFLRASQFHQWWLVLGEGELCTADGYLDMMTKGKRNLTLI